MVELWRSDDGYMRVVDGCVSGQDSDGATVAPSDLDTVFRDHAYIVIYQYANDDRWFVARSRRTPKPSLKRLAFRVPDAITINAEDTHGKIITDEDPCDVARMLYDVWQDIAAETLPRKIAALIATSRLPEFQRDEPPGDRIPMWLRPGLARYAERRRAWRELYEDITA